MIKKSEKTIQKRKPSVAIVALSNPKTDPRVARQISSLSGKYRLHVLAYTEGTQRAGDNVTYHNLQKPKSSTNAIQAAISSSRSKTLLLKDSPFLVVRLLYRLMRFFFRTANFMRSLLIFACHWTPFVKQQSLSHLLANPELQAIRQYLQDLPVDLVIANDLEAFVAVAMIPGFNGKILFDAHEYFPRELEQQFKWRIEQQWFKTFLCRKFIPRADLMITVCNEIAQAYTENFQVSAPIKIITSAPEYHKITPTTPRMPIKLVHHGIAAPARRLENMIATMALLPDSQFHLTLMLVPVAQDYMKELSKLAIKVNTAKGREVVRFVDPAPMPEICKTINKYDMELIMIPPVNFNYEMALPNKFFEAVQARIGLAIAPMPAMARFVNKYKIGVVAQTFEPESMATALKDLSIEQITAFKRNTNRAAKENNAEHNALILRDSITELLA